MTASIATRALLISFALACSACAGAASGASADAASSPRAQAAVAPAGGAPVEACTLFTMEEIAAAVGRSDFARGKRKDEGANCYYSSSRGGLNVWTVPSVSKQSFDDFRDLLNAQAKHPETIAGVGDDAYFWDDRLYVRIGGRGLTVEVNQNALDPQPHATLRAAAVALAKTGVPKLR